MSGDAVEAVVRAWTDAGPAPTLHKAAIRRLHSEWPTLAQAIQALVDQHAEDNA